MKRFLIHLLGGIPEEDIFSAPKKLPPLEMAEHASILLRALHAVELERDDWRKLAHGLHKSNERLKAMLPPHA